MIDKKAFSSISLAMKAGFVASGEFLTEKAVKEGKAKLVIVAEDASVNTKKKMSNMCEYYQVPILFLGTKVELGHIIGKEFRASVAILNQGFAEMIQKQQI